MRSMDLHSRFTQRSVGAARRHGPALTVLVALTIIMCRNLLFTDEYPGGWDVASITYPIAYMAKTDSYFSLWEDGGTGYVTPISLFHLLSFVADVLGDPALMARAVVIVAVLAAALLMYLYAYATTGRVLASLASAIIFATSQWFVSKVASGHGFLFLAYALIPLIFLVLERGLERATLLRVLMLGLLVSLLPSLRLDPVVYILPFVALFALWWVATAGRAWRSAVLKTLRLLLPAVILGALLSAYVWMPLLRTGTMHSTLRFGLSVLADNTLSFWPTLKGQGLAYSYLFWRGGTSLYTHTFLPPLVYGAVLLLTPALAFAQVRLRDDRRVSFFLIAALVSVFLAKGTWQPLGEVYTWLWRYVPFVDRLHVPNRWLMVGWFAYAFLAGLTVDRVYRTSKKRLQGVGSRPLRLTVPAAAVALLLLGCTVGVSYAFTDGFQTWGVPEEEVAAHQWLGENAGSGRFLGVPYEGNRSFVPGGWMQHDLGFAGGMFSGLASFDESYFHTYADDVFTEVGKLIARKSESLAKVVGLYDVRYVVVQGYSANALPRHPLTYADTSPINVEQEYAEHEYFERLDGLREVFEGPEPEYTLLVGEDYESGLTGSERGPQLWVLEPSRRSVVYENEFWVPRVFVPGRRMLVVGGLESLETIAAFDELSFQDWDVRFASRVLSESGREGLLEALRGTEVLLLDNSELLDLAMMIADLAPADFSAISTDPETLWTRSSSSSLLTSEQGFIQTRENHAQVTLAIGLDTGLPTQEYELWARVFYGPVASLIQFELDGQEVGSLLPSAGGDVDYLWEKVGTATLEPGLHEVSVTALATAGSFDTRLAEVALVRAGAVEEAAELLVSVIEEAQVDVVSLQDESRLWRRSAFSTQLSRFDQWEIPLEHLEEAGVQRALYGGQEALPRFLPGGRFLVREGKPASGYTPLLQLEFGEPQDWSRSTYLLLDLKGLDSGEEVRLRIDFGDSGKAVYSFNDLSSVWKTVTIPLYDPTATEGIVRWDQVSSLTIGMSGTDVEEGVGLGTITLMEDRLSLQSLGSALGMQTFLLSPQDPTPAPVGELLSAPGERPAEILAWEQTSAWLYRLRVDATAPYTLVFSSTYDPLWRVFVDGEEISPQSSYYFVNAYAIDEVGEYELTLEFVGQRYQRSAFAVSGVAFGATLAAVVVCLLNSWRKDRRTDLPAGMQEAKSQVDHAR